MATEHDATCLPTFPSSHPVVLLALFLQIRFIGDQNPFRESSAGVHFFGVSTLNPELYAVQKGERSLRRPFGCV